VVHVPAQFPRSREQRFDSPIQERVHRRLALIGPGPAAFFRDAYRLISNPDLLETTAHLVGHCLREIESAVRKVLLPKSGTQRRSDEGHRSEVEAVLDAYAMGRETGPARAWLRLANRHDEFGLHRQAHRNALQPARAPRTETLALWDHALVFLDGVLDRFEAQFVLHVRTVEDLARAVEPTAAHISQLRQDLPNNDVTLARFFAIAGPGWLPQLLDAGYFSSPPAPELSVDGTHVSFRQWSASNYLARVASASLPADAALLARVLHAIPDTENIWVRSDIAAAAIAIPVEESLAIARRASAWLDRGCAVHFPEHLAALAFRIMRNGQVEEGLEVFRPLLRLELSARPRAYLVASFDEYSFQKNLEASLPQLAEVAGLRAFSVVCDALEGACELARMAEDRLSDRDDGCAFRCSIEQHQQDRHYEDRPLSLLIDVVRDLAEVLVRSNAKALDDVLREVDGRAPLVFKRVAMHLVRTCPQADVAWVTRYLMDPAFLEAHEVWRERRLLERDAFGRLDLDQQEQVFADVRRRAADQADARMRSWWIERHLALLVPWLPADLRSEFEQATAEGGPPKHPDLLWHSGDDDARAVSRTSLEGLPPGDVATFLSTWTPSSDNFLEHERTDDLVRQLTRLVAHDPRAYAEMAERFQDGQPRFVWAVLAGFAEAIKKELPFPWDGPLALCRWVSGQTPDAVGPGGGDDGGDGSTGWRWTQKQVADLLVAALEDGPCSIEPRELDRVLDVVAVLLRVPEGDDTSPSGDAYSRAINSLHGASVEALIHAALWHGGRAGEQRRLHDRTRRLLEEELRVGSVLTHAMLGRYLPNLVGVDRGWVSDHLGQLLPAGPLGQVAWGVYLRWFRPDPRMLELLTDQFAGAIRRLPSAAGDDEEVATALIHHLAPLYWWGFLELESGLLKEFFATATTTQRAELLKHVGFCFLHTEGPVEADIVARAQELWASRRRALDDGTTTIEELRPFGWWFASAKFPEAWALAELHEVLLHQPDVELAHAVADRLGALATENPREALKCLSLLCDGDTVGWRVSACRTGVETAVRHAKASGDDTIAQVAGELVSRLVAQGHVDFLAAVSGPLG